MQRKVAAARVGHKNKTEEMETQVKVLPLERIVDCECDPRLGRQILHYNYGSEKRVAACMNCGQVTCYYSMGDEPRGAGEAGGANFIVGVPEVVMKWLSGFPRLLTLGPTSDDPIWVGANTRCRDWDSLNRLIDEETRATAAMPSGRRLARLPVPKAPFPALGEGEWAREFRSYIQVHDLLTASVEQPVEVLVQQAASEAATHSVAVDRLLRRADIETLLSDGLRASESREWATWLSVLRWDRPPRRAVIAALGEGLARHPLTPFEDWPGHIRQHMVIQELLGSLVSLRVPSEWCEDDLRVFQERVGKRDWDLVGEISRTRRTLAAH